MHRSTCVLLILVMVSTVGCGQERAGSPSEPSGGEPDAGPNGVSKVVSPPPATGCGAGDLNEREHRAVKRLLKQRYPAKSVKAPNNQKLLGIRFVPERTCFKALSIPEMSEARPTTKVYLAELDTNYHEFPRVPVALVLEDTQGFYEVHECFSPLFTEPNTPFFALLLGVDVPEREGRERLSLGIAKILKEITHAGKLENGRYGDDDIYRIELWSGELHFRNLAFHFSPAGKLREMNITNAKTQKLVMGISRN